jgi:hypothetical protein
MFHTNTPTVDAKPVQLQGATKPTAYPASTVSAKTELKLTHKTRRKKRPAYDFSQTPMLRKFNKMLELMAKEVKGVFPEVKSWGDVSVPVKFNTKLERYVYILQLVENREFELNRLGRKPDKDNTRGVCVGLALIKLANKITGIEFQHKQAINKILHCRDENLLQEFDAFEKVFLDIEFSHWGYIHSAIDKNFPRINMQWEYGEILEAKCDKPMRMTWVGENFFQIFSQIENNTMVIIRNAKQSPRKTLLHAVGVVRQGDTYYYFDSDHKDMTLIPFDINELENLFLAINQSVHTFCGFQGKYVWLDFMTPAKEMINSGVSMLKNVFIQKHYHLRPQVSTKPQTLFGTVKPTLTTSSSTPALTTTTMREEKMDSANRKL